jgi:hypothetical protein
MRAALAEGCSPREGPYRCVDLGRQPEGRPISLVRRGSRYGWEPFLGDSGRPVWGPSYGPPLGESACVCVRPPFRAAHLTLEWMPGRALGSPLGDFEYVGRYPAGIVLRPEIVSRLLVLRIQDAEPGATTDGVGI